MSVDSATYFFEVDVSGRTLTFAADGLTEDEAFAKVAQDLWQRNFRDLASGKVGDFRCVGEL